MSAPLLLSGPDNLTIELDPGSMLDLRRVIAGGVDWSPGLAIVDDGDPRIRHALQGFLFTCGPDHVRHPEPIASGAGHYPLHGSAAGHRAVGIESTAGSCRGSIRIGLADGGEALVERQWEIGSDGWVSLRDRLTNSGGAPFAPMMMYHTNIGGGLLGPETRLEGEMFPDGGMAWDFFDDPGGVFCVPASPVAEIGGEAVLRLGPVAQADGLTLEVRFPTPSLPHLQMWRARREGVNVLGIEPCSHRRAKRQALAEAGELAVLAPGEMLSCGLRFRFSLAARPSSR
ncbi:hypothetical protein GGR23_000649 [Gellertiella hungarica]|uniref:DUF4432 domain-containing protein n=2 Tax=Gellertiella hungarica TaxID=1572859 RepID=A0A7W6NJ87_9HYPH|nr:hypothetical protein [Gellertiella hungarica]